MAGIVDPEDESRESTDTECSENETDCSEHDSTTEAIRLELKERLFSLTADIILDSCHLPLSPHDAAELTRICHRAPFGKGSETFVDTTVRNTWELNTDQFELRNPIWQSWLDKALIQVSDDLGIEGGSTRMKAELYKLLLYDEGAFFESHKDTEKAKGMFGTLVVALPSKHTGGGVETKFGDHTRSFKTAESSEFGYSYLAWYSDVEHSVKPVTSGHRLVLTYNLTFVAAEVPRSSLTTSAYQAPWNSYLALWNSKRQDFNAQCPSMLIYMLDHQYTDANLRFDHLKGTDSMVAKSLKQACHDQDFYFFLANLERTENGSCDYDPFDPFDYHSGGGSAYGSRYNYSSGGQIHDLEEVFETTLELKSVFESSGKRLAKSVPIEESDIVQDDPFDRDPDDEDYEGYTGNEGASSTHFYRDSCIVLMPRDYRNVFLLEPARNGNVEVEAWIGSATDLVRKAPGDERLRKDLLETCELLLQSCPVASEAPSYRWGQPRGLSNAELDVIAGATLQLSNSCLFESVAAKGKQAFPLDIFIKIGDLLGENPLDEWQRGIELALDHTQKVHEKFEALTAILRASAASQSNSSSSPNRADVLESLVRRSLEISLSRSMEIHEEDAPALIEMTRKYGGSIMFESIFPFVKRHLANATCAIAFLSLLFEAEKDGGVETGLAKNVHRDILSNLISGIEVDTGAPSAKRQKLTIGSSVPPNPERTQWSLLKGNDVAELIHRCRSLELGEEQEAIMGKLVAASGTVISSAIETLFIPLLTHLVELLRSNGNPPYSDPPFQTFFQNIIDSYVRRYIGNEPAKPQDWALNQRGCGCRDFQGLDDFLTDPHARIRRFPVGKQRRAHLHQKLDGTGCTHETERLGNPQTLIVTKTRSVWEKAHKAWQDRCLSAKQIFEKMGLEELKLLLEDRFEEVTELRAVKPTTAASQRLEAGNGRTPLGPVAPSQGQSIKETQGPAGKVDIVDLCSD